MRGNLCIHFYLYLPFPARRLTFQFFLNLRAFMQSLASKKLFLNVGFILPAFFLPSGHPQPVSCFLPMTTLSLSPSRPAFTWGHPASPPLRPRRCRGSWRGRPEAPLPCAGRYCAQAFHEGCSNEVAPPSSSRWPPSVCLNLLPPCKCPLGLSG